MGISSSSSSVDLKFGQGTFNENYKKLNPWASTFVSELLNYGINKLNNDKKSANNVSDKSNFSIFIGAMLQEPFINFRKKQSNDDNKIDKQKQTIKINILKKLFLSGDENLFTKEEIVILHLLFYYLEKITLGDVLLESIKYEEVDLEFRTEPFMISFEFDMISEVIYAIIYFRDHFYSEVLSCYEKMNPKNPKIINIYNSLKIIECNIQLE
jgi:hypothetical protein